MKTFRKKGSGKEERFKELLAETDRQMDLKEARLPQLQYCVYFTTSV